MLKVYRNSWVVGTQPPAPPIAGAAFLSPNTSGSNADGSRRPAGSMDTGVPNRHQSLPQSILRLVFACPLVSLTFLLFYAAIYLLGRRNGLIAVLLQGAGQRRAELSDVTSAKQLVWANLGRYVAPELTRKDNFPGIQQDHALAGKMDGGYQPHGGKGVGRTILKNIL